MVDNNTGPRGGFFRGVLAGITFIFFVFCVLAYFNPLNGTATVVLAGSESAAPAVSMNTAPVALPVDSNDAPLAIALPSDSQSPIQFGANPAPFGSSGSTDSSDVSFAPSAPSQVSAVSVLDPATTSSGISFGTNADSAPAVEAPQAPVIGAATVSAAPEVDQESATPEVSVSVGGVTTNEDLPSVSEPTAVAAATDSSAVGGFGAGTQGNSDESVALAGQNIAQTGAVQESAIGESTTTAFATYMTEINVSEDKPFLSFVILARDLSMVVEAATLSVPVTLAVSSENPAAAEIIAAHRNNGGEVLVLLPTEGQNELRNGGNASTVAPRLEAILANKNGAIGVLDGISGDLIKDQRMLTALIAELGKTGHALVTVDGFGQNRGNVMASEASLPATSVTKAFDETLGRVQVKQGMDKVILGMGDSQAITVYSESPESVDALSFWLKGQKSRLVNVVPISATILRGN